MTQLMALVERGEAKECTRCKLIKILDDFVYHPRGRLERQSWCKACTAAHNKHRRNSDPAMREADRVQTLAYAAAERLLRERHADEFRWLYEEQLKIQALKAAKAENL